MQVVEKRRGKLTIIAHVGSAHTETELGLLLERGRQILHGGQQTLDLELQDPVRSAPLIPTPESKPSLFEVPESNSHAPRAVDRPRTVGTVSDVLWSTLRQAYARLGFNALGDEVFEQLVLARLVEPTSKLDSLRVLTELGVAAPHRNTIGTCLKRVHSARYRDQIARACLTYAATSGDINLILYDVTTLYFEADKEDDLRKVGFSKERRVDPQIVVGLLVDRTGFPLEIGCFEGNRAETKTILPIIEQFQDRHGLADLVVVADAGMLSATNLRELDEAGLGFIVGSRQTKAPHDLAHHFHWHGDAFTDGQVIDTLASRHGNTKNPDTKKRRREPVWDRDQHPGAWRAIWAYSRKRAVRDGKTLTAQENRARAIINGDKQAKRTRFVKETASGRRLDQANLERARSLVGLKGYYCNIPAHVMAPGEVISSYHDLWQVEQSFRMSKTDLRARPMFHRTREAIEAHVTIVFAALGVARFMQARTGLSLKKIITTLRPIRAALVRANGQTAKIPAHIPENAADMIRQITAESGH